MAQDKKQREMKKIKDIIGNKKLSPSEQLRAVTAELQARRADIATGDERFLSKRQKAVGITDPNIKAPYTPKERPSQSPWHDYFLGSSASQDDSQSLISRLFQGTDPKAQQFSTKTPEQIKFMEDLLPLINKQLPGLLQQLSGQQQESPLQSELGRLFGTTTNPILQGLMGGQQNNTPQVLFPSQIAQQGNQDLDRLLGQLAPIVIGRGLEQVPELYSSFMKSRPGQFAQQLPGNLMEMLSGLGNRFMGSQQPSQQ